MLASFDHTVSYNPSQRREGREEKEKGKKEKGEIITRKEEEIQNMLDSLRFIIGFSHVLVLVVYFSFINWLLYCHCTGPFLPLNALFASISSLHSTFFKT